MKRTIAATLTVILAGGSLALLAQSSGQKSLAATLNVAAFPAGRAEARAAVAGRGRLLQVGRGQHGRRSVRGPEEGRAAAAADRPGHGAGQVGRTGLHRAHRGPGRSCRSPDRRRRRRRRNGGRRRRGDRSGRGPKTEEEGRGAGDTSRRRRRASRCSMATAQQIEGFKKAFCACLEGKKYIAQVLICQEPRGRLRPYRNLVPETLLVVSDAGGLGSSPA